METGKRIIDLTAGEFADLLKDALSATRQAEHTPQRLVKGVRGIMSVLQRSRNYVAERHALGVYDSACVAGGVRGKLYDADRLLEIEKPK